MKRKANISKTKAYCVTRKTLKFGARPKEISCSSLVFCFIVLYRGVVESACSAQEWPKKQNKMDGNNNERMPPNKVVYDESS